eukprot:CAMPEP_0195655538 /NCGR_PEP_ID=MMETSP0815-20121206/34514_1 /TAXON_ID=97485 /ORGANISM="Prymnesium parvum, Strain Texoma1" /LENGTH=65 /DNA_ID=CAMNT_0040799837 /DNA_START=1271 /DNA_END=1465 /DNA_ORIENTATION=-
MHARRGRDTEEAIHVAHDIHTHVVVMEGLGMTASSEGIGDMHMWRLRRPRRANHLFRTFSQCAAE